MPSHRRSDAGRIASLVLLPLAMAAGTLTAQNSPASREIFCAFLRTDCEIQPFIAGVGVVTSSREDAPPVDPVPIRSGQTISGSIAYDDLVADDMSFYDEYVFEGRTGQRVIITLRSEDFDAFVWLGFFSDGEFFDLAADDDGGGGTDALIDVVLEEDGEYIIRANTLEAHEVGRYTVSLVIQ